MLLNALKLYGIDIVRMLQTARGLPRYCRDCIRFRAIKPDGWPLSFRPYLSDFFDSSGRVTVHYFKQDIFVAREIHRYRPRRHIDIGSRVDGFISHLAVFMKVEIIDIRPNRKLDPQIRFLQADVCVVDPAQVGWTDSISCLHTIEHIGLGRYGDPIGADPWVEAVDRIFGLLETGGLAYLSMPIGRKRIEFNAHRIFDLQELLGLMATKGKILKVALIDDRDDLEEYEDLVKLPILATKHWKFGCGIFVIQKQA